MFRTVGLVCMRALQYMAAWSIAGAFCGTMTGVMTAAALYIGSNQTAVVEIMAAGTLGGVYGGMVVGLGVGAFNQVHPKALQAHAALISAAMGGAMGATIAGVIIGNAMGAVADGARWALASGMLGVVLGALLNKLTYLIMQQVQKQSSQWRTISVRWLAPSMLAGALGAVMAGPIGRIIDTPHLGAEPIFWGNVLGGALAGGAIGALVVSLFIITAYAR